MRFRCLRLTFPLWVDVQEEVWGGGGWGSPSKTLLEPPPNTSVYAKRPAFCLLSEDGARFLATTIYFLPHYFKVSMIYEGQTPDVMIVINLNRCERKRPTADLYAAYG